MKLLLFLTLLIPATMIVAADFTVPGSTAINGNLSVTGTINSSGAVTNSNLTASQAVFTDASKVLSSTGTSTGLRAALSDPTGTESAVFQNSPTLKEAVVITNATSANVSLTINGPSGGTNDLFRANAGGTNSFRVDKNGNINVAGGTATAVSIGFGGVSNAGFYFGSPNLWLASGGNTIIGLASDSSVRLQSGGHFSFTSSSTSAAGTEDTIILRDSPATVQQGSDAASPVDQTFKSADGSGTDKNGAKLTVEGGQSTGTGRGGPAVIRTAVTHVTSSSTANIYEERAHYVPKFVTLTDNTIATIFSVTLPATNSIGMTFTCTIECSDGTDFQSLTTPVTIDAVNKAGTISPVVRPSAAQTDPAGGGTLSVTYAVADGGSNTLNVRVTADTSLTSLLYLRARIVMTGINSIGAGVVINEI